MQWIRVFPHLKKQKIIGLVFTFGASDLGKHTQCRQYIRWTAIYIVFTRVCLLIMYWSLILNWLFLFATIQWYSTTWQCYFEKSVFGQSIGEVGSGHSESWEAREGLVTHLPYCEEAGMGGDRAPEVGGRCFERHANLKWNHGTVLLLSIITKHLLWTLYSHLLTTFF